MVFKLKVRLSLAALFVAAAFPALFQVAPSATERYLPLEIGAGFAGFETHDANSNPNLAYPPFRGRLYGPTLWVDGPPGYCAESALRGRDETSTTFVRVLIRGCERTQARQELFILGATTGISMPTAKSWGDMGALIST